MQKINQVVEELTHDISIISLDSENGDDSVIFVAEEAVSQDMKQLAKINRKVEQLEAHNRKMEVHIKALQSRVLAQEAPNQIESTSTENFNLSDSWIEKQINEWRDNGEIEEVIQDFEKFVEDQM